MKWLVAMFLVSSGALSACASSETAGKWTALPDEQALEGEWGGTDQSRITFSVDGKYGWERTIACGTPPCPTNWVSGTWRVQHGKLYLDPNVGGDEIVVFRFEDQQKYLYLKDGDAEKMYVRSL